MAKLDIWYQISEKKYLLGWGSNPQNETKPEEIYGHEREGIREIVKLVLLDFNKKGLFYSNFFEFDVKS